MSLSLCASRLTSSALIRTLKSPPPHSLLRFASSSTSPPNSRLPPTALPTPTPRPPQKKHKKSKPGAASRLPTLREMPANDTPPPFTSADSDALFNLPKLNVGLNSGRGKVVSDGKAIALTTAEGYDMGALLKSLFAMGLMDSTAGATPLRAVNLLGEAVYVPSWSPAADAHYAGTEPETGEVFIFESGTVVTWGLSKKAAEAFVRQIIRGSAGPEKSLEWVESGRYSTSEMEILDYRVNPKGPTKIDGDNLQIRSFPATETSANVTDDHSDLLARLAFSAGMARVTKLGVYEEQFDDFAESNAEVPQQLMSGSKKPLQKEVIVKNVGRLHEFRQKLNLEDENLLDEPEFLWEDAKLHAHYTDICEALEFDTRLAILNQRVDYAFQLQSTLEGLLNTNTSHRLEWIIIILIAVEIFLVLEREGMPFLHRLTGGKGKPVTAELHMDGKKLHMVEA